MIRLTAICLILFLACPGWSYTSRSGHFSCPNPVENSLGGKVSEGHAYVSFVDDFGQLYRVETIPLDKESKNLLEQQGRSKFLENTLYNFYLPQTILRAIPNATVKDLAYVKNLRNGAFIGYVLMPQGASVEVTHIDLKNNTEKTGRPDTMRAILSFIEKDRIVFVSSELSPRRKDDPKANLSKELQDQVIRFAQQVQVLSDGSAKESSRYHNQVQRFSVVFPAGSNVSEEDSNNRVLAQLRTGGSSDRLLAHMSVGWDAVDGFKTLEAKAKYVEDAMRQGLNGDLQIFCNEEAAMGGKRALKKCYRAGSGQNETLTLIYLGINNGNFYQINCTSLQQDFNRLKPVFEQVRKSFQYE